MHLYAFDLFKMLSQLRQFKFRRFSKSVIQSVLVLFANTTAVYSTIYEAISRAVSNVSAFFWRLSIKVLFRLRLGFFFTVTFVYMYISFSFNRTLRQGIALPQGVFALLVKLIKIKYVLKCHSRCRYGIRFVGCYNSITKEKKRNFRAQTKSSKIGLPFIRNLPWYHDQ